MIAGQSPRIEWRSNSDGQVRTIEEAIEIAKRNGVVIPDDVSFWEDEDGELNANFTACGPRIDKEDGSVVYWSDLVHDITGKIPFRIWPGILESDEAITAVLAHEMFELEKLRHVIKSGSVRIGQLYNMTCPGNTGNFHDLAWEYADSLVIQMRRKEQL